MDVIPNAGGHGCWSNSQKEGAKGAKERDGMKYRHCNNIDKKLRTRLDARWTRSKQAEVGGWVSALNGKEGSGDVGWSLSRSSDRRSGEAEHFELDSVLTLERFHHQQCPFHFIPCA